MVRHVGPFFASFVAVVLLLLTSKAHAIPVERLVDPRPSSRCLDTTGTLKPSSRTAIESTAAEARAAGNGEIMVVVVPSTDGEVPRGYATRLFNRWRIGDASNRGVLVFAALGDRKAEIILGDGISDSAHVRESQAIMDRDMVPLFKQGNPEGAIVAATRESAARLLGFGSSTRAGTVGNLGGSRPARPSDAFPWGGLGLGMGGGAAIVAFVASVVFGRRALRRRPRRCPHCNGTMVLLDEVADDAHLSSGERAEERVQSVDYDVWYCRCGYAMKQRHGKWFTRYARCPSCSAKTKLKSERVISHATESSTGLMRITENCEHCNYHHCHDVVIACVTPASSSSYDSGGSSFDSGGGGGGSSSGDGASGSW